MRRVVVTVLALAALAASAWGGTEARCASSAPGRCCCPAPTKHRPERVELRARCCEISQPPSGAEPMQREVEPVARHALAVTIAPVSFGSRPPIVSISAVRARADHGPPRSLFAHHCALLL